MNRIKAVCLLTLTLLLAPSSWAANDSALVATLAKSAEIPVDEAQRQVDNVIEAIKVELLAGRPITIRNFGKFYVTEMGAREVRNPRTGEKIQIEARRYPKFSSADGFKKSFRETAHSVVATDTAD